MSSPRDGKVGPLHLLIPSPVLFLLYHSGDELEAS